MNFLTDKVCKYQEKKLKRSNTKIKNLLKDKKRLEHKIKTTNDKSDSITKEITAQNEIISIWEKNIIKIKEQIKKLKRSIGEGIRLFHYHPLQNIAAFFTHKYTGLIFLH